MSDPILHARFTALKSSLKEVRSFSTTITGRRKNILKLFKILFESEESFEDRMSDLNSGLTSAIAELKKFEGKYRHDGRGVQFRQVRQDLERLQGETLDGEEGLIQSATKMTELVKDIKHKFLEDILDQNGNLDQSGDNWRSQMDSRTDDVESRLSEEGMDQPVPMWRRHAEVVALDGPGLFNEYMDLLAGFTLREAGVADEICQIADDLLRWSAGACSLTWNSLTVPARKAGSKATFTRLIRMGYPEWNIWALPLALHEFGYLYSEDKWTGGNRTPLNQQYLTRANLLWDASKRESWDLTDPLLQELAADAFATNLLGPSYACAALFLRLNPGQAQDGSNTDLLRAETILRVLAKNEIYGELPKDLRTTWETAVKAANDGVMQQPAIPLSDLDEYLFGETSSGPNIFKLTNDIRFNVRGDRWTLVTEWVEAGHFNDDEAMETFLKSSQQSGPKIPPLMEMLTVLNGAWFARQLHPNSNSEHIEKAALRFCRTLLAERRNRKAKHGTPGVSGYEDSDD